MKREVGRVQTSKGVRERERERDGKGEIMILQMEANEFM